MLWLSVGCAIAVAVAVLGRATSSAALAGVSAALGVAGLALAVWLPSGPLASGWSEKAGTPKSLLHPASASASRGARVR